MGFKTWMAAGSVAIASVIYMMYPEPQLTTKLLQWKNGGQFLHFKGFQIFYKVVNGRKKDGSTLLCLHGFPTSSYDWIKPASRMLAIFRTRTSSSMGSTGILNDLQEEFSMIVMYDYIGFGLSDKPNNHTYSIIEQADIGEALLKSLAVTKVHMLSHDYGDTVALELLARYNNKNSNDGRPVIQSLCLTNGGIFPETNFPRPVQKLLLNPYIGPIASRLSNFIIFSKGFGEIFGPQTGPDQDELWDFYVMMSHKGGTSISYRLLQYITERSKYKDRWVGALKSTTIKVHMIYGPSDPVNPSAFIEFYKKTVPQHGITVLGENIGHYPQWEAPRELMEAYSKFLKVSRP